MAMILPQKLGPAAQNQTKWEVEAILSEAEEKVKIFPPTFNLNRKSVFFHHEPSTYFQFFLKH